MSDLIIVGNAAAIETPVRRIWSRNAGGQIERRWWGASDAVDALYPDVLATARANNVMDVTLERATGSAISILTVRYASQEVANVNDIVDLMEIDFTDQSFPISYNPTFSTMTATEITTLKKLSERDPPGTNPYTAPDVRYYYYELLLQGVENYRAKLPVVTWTRSVPENYPTELDLADVGKILTTDQLVADVGAPVLWDIPTANVAVVASTDWTTGWLKDVKAGYDSNGKIQLVIRAEYGRWSDHLYPSA